MKEKNMVLERRKALAHLLKVDFNDIYAGIGIHKKLNSFNVWQNGKGMSNKYLVLTEDEAISHAKLQIYANLYKMETDTICTYIEEKVNRSIIADIQSFGISANIILRKLIGENYGVFVTDNLDLCNNLDNGFARYIQTADNKESQFQGYYIYKVA